MFLKNEYLFFLEIFFIVIFLLIFLKKKYIELLYQLLVYIFIFINIISGINVLIFNINCSIAEPLGILMYFLTIFLYNWNKDYIKKFFKNMYIINIFLFIIFNIFLLYQGFDNFFSIFIKEYLFNVFVSMISFKISYIIEQSIFNLFYTINTPYREGFSVAIGQLFDTVFFSILIFFNKPYYIIMEIIFFSYVLKLLCIFIYTSLLRFIKI